MISLTIKEIASMINGTLYINEADENDLVNGVVIDSREVQKGNLYVPIVGNRVDGHSFIADVENKGATLTFCSNIEYLPQKMAVLVVEDTLASMQDLAKAYRKILSATVIGITGSNGKTSCKDILAGALSIKLKTQKTQGNKNNEIGVPLTLLSLDRDVEAAVVEMGMENREEIHFLNPIVSQNIAVITNVGIAHLENLGSIENIGRAKLEIIDHLQPGSLFVYYGDDPILTKLMKKKVIPEGVRVLTFGKEKSNDVYLTSLSQDYDGIRFQLNEDGYSYHLPMLGEHQAINAMAAIIIAKDLGLHAEEIQQGFYRIEKTGMRNELMTIGNCTILNDAYKSNPQSARAALETFHGFDHPYKICVLADMLDLGDTTANLHHALGYSLNKYGFKEILCMGELSNYIAEGAKESCQDAKIVHFNDREELFDYLKDYIKRDCMILFKGSRGMALDLVIDKMKEYGE